MKCTWETSHRLVRRPAGWRATRVLRWRIFGPLEKQVRPNFSTTLLRIRTCYPRRNDFRYPNIFFRRGGDHRPFSQVSCPSLSICETRTMAANLALKKMADHVSLGMAGILRRWKSFARVNARGYKRERSLVSKWLVFISSVFFSSNVGWKVLRLREKFSCDWIGSKDNEREITLSFVVNLNDFLKIILHFEKIFQKIFDLQTLIYTYICAFSRMYEFNFKNFRTFKEKLMIRAYLFPLQNRVLRENFVAIPRICTILYGLLCSCILGR